MGALYLERVLGYSPLEIGLAFLPTTVIMGTLSVRYTERLVMHFGARRSVVAGLVVLTAGFVVFAQAPVDGSYWTHVLPVTLLVGAGAGLCFLRSAGRSGSPFWPRSRRRARTPSSGKATPRLPHWSAATTWRSGSPPA